MKKTKVDSSIVLAIGYDKAKSLLEVELLSHDVYDYLGVPEDVYRSFLTAESKGRYYNFFIKPFYEYRQVKKSA